MGVIYDHDERFTDIVQVIGFLDQAFFTGKRGSFVVYFKSMAQDFDGVKIRMQGPCKGSGKPRDHFQLCMLAGILKSSTMLPPFMFLQGASELQK